MRVLVCGGRDYNNKQLVFDTLEYLLNPTEAWMPDPNHVIIHGGATGADALADDWAIINWVQIEEYKADWRQYGHRAGPIRNSQMLKLGKPDIVLAFPGGAGTQDMIDKARKAGVEVREIDR